MADSIGHRPSNFNRHLDKLFWRRHASLVQMTDESSASSAPSTKSAGAAAQPVQQQQAESAREKNVREKNVHEENAREKDVREEDLLEKLSKSVAWLATEGRRWLGREGRRWLARTWSGLSLSRVQAIVAVVTGIVTIMVGIHTLAHFTEPVGGTGEFVAVVQEAASAKSLPDATIEVQTPQNALVATLTPDSRGRARQSLREGTYVVRVNHPNYATEVRHIQVFSQQIVEIKVGLRPGSPSPVDQAKRTVGDGLKAVRRAFHF
jgi:hypothetical protein